MPGGLDEQLTGVLGPLLVMAPLRCSHRSAGCSPVRRWLVWPRTSPSPLCEQEPAVARTAESPQRRERSRARPGATLDLLRMYRRGDCPPNSGREGWDGCGTFIGRLVVEESRATHGGRATRRHGVVGRRLCVGGRCSGQLWRVGCSYGVPLPGVFAAPPDPCGAAWEARR